MIEKAPAKNTADLSVYDMFPDMDALPDRRRETYPDIRDPFFWSVYERFKPYSMVSAARFENVFQSIKFIAERNVPGDIVECGVYLGGLMAAMGMFAQHFGLKGRTFWLFDSFEGFPPEKSEVDLHGEVVAFDAFAEAGHFVHFRERTEKTLAMADFGDNKIRIEQGYVEDTLPKVSLDEIALLRLDTDYYESTLLELQLLYPKLSTGGVLIIDDYGHFQGARKAVDTYFAETRQALLLNRVDYSARSGIKV